MAFSDYEQIREVVKEFGLDHQAQNNLFPQVEPVEPSSVLAFYLGDPAERALLQQSEIGRRESIIAPFLIEAASRASAPTMLYPDMAFDVTEKLSGFPDYLLGRGNNPVVIQAPIFAVAQAKDYDFFRGAAQCAAEMVAARDFNASKNLSGPVFGCVTNGSEWEFYRLDDNKLQRNKKQLYLNQPAQILGVLIAIASGTV